MRLCLKVRVGVKSLNKEDFFMLQITPLPLLKDNYAYFIEDSVSGMCAVIDPGEAGPVWQFLQEKEKKLSYILNTHHHWDHVNGNRDLQRKTDAQIVGFEGDRGRIPGQTIFLKEGDVFCLGAAHAHVLFIPGHTTGHIAYYFEQDDAVFTGDTLFSLGCGRLFEGTPKQMWKSLEKLASLPNQTRIFCGHEYTLANLAFAKHVFPQDEQLWTLEEELRQKRAKAIPTTGSTMAFEKRFNPFLQGILEASSPQEAQRLFQERRASKDIF